MQASSFGAVVLLGNQHLWIENFRVYLHSRGGVITNPVYRRLEMTIYQFGGIDFIFPNVDLNEIVEVRRATNKIKDFIGERLYLEFHLLFFLNYMSPKFQQVLQFLSCAEIDIDLVSLRPGTATETLYFQTCVDLNIKTHIISEKVLRCEDMKRIIRNVFSNLGSLIELFESCNV